MQADLSKILPSLAIAFTVMLVKDLMINTKSTVQASSSSASESTDTATATSQEQAQITPPKPDSFEFDEEEEDEDEYVAPKSVNSYSKQLMVKFLICTS